MENLTEDDFVKIFERVYAVEQKLRSHKRLSILS